MYRETSIYINSIQPIIIPAPFFRPWLTCRCPTTTEIIGGQEVTRPVDLATCQDRRSAVVYGSSMVESLPKNANIWVVVWKIWKIFC